MNSRRNAMNSNRAPTIHGCMRFAAILAVMMSAIAARAAEPIFPTGSPIGLVPPAGMAPSGGFMGFEDRDKSAAILLATFPADAFEQLDKSMFPDALKKQGIDIEKREPIEVHAGRGFLLSGKQSINDRRFRKFMLVAAAGKVTALVTVQVPEQDNAYSDMAVRDALTTLAVRTVPDAERLSLLPFTVGDLAGFRIDDVLPGRAVMLVEGPPALEQSNQGSAGTGPADANSDMSGRPINARFLIAARSGGPSELKDAGEFARTTFAQIGGIKTVRIQDAEPLRIGGQPGYETLADAKDPQSDGELRVVQWLRFGAGGYLQMIGIARAEFWLDEFPRMRKMRDSIDLK